MEIYDTHAHLDHCRDIFQALQEAYTAGVKGIVAVGVDWEANKKNLELKEKIQNPEIYMAMGIHPGNINPEEIDGTLCFIREHIGQVVAIGEIGLDYWYKDVRKNKEKKEKQHHIFRRQLYLAAEFNLPVVVHSRGAWRDCLNILKETGTKKAEFHWYSGPLDILKEILQQGYYLSATPSLAYSPQHQDAIKYAPVEQTLIETDTPVYYKGTPQGFEARPKDVFRTLRLYSELKHIEEEKTVHVLNRNAEEFFGINYKERILS